MSEKNSAQSKPIALDCALADLRSPKGIIAIRQLIDELKRKVDGHESGEDLLIDIAYSDYNHDLELLKKLMGS